MASIPASELVNVTPSVIAAGGTGLDLNGLVLTNSTRVPVGAVVPFATLEDVEAYFGAQSDEAGFAAVYFAGYDNSTLKPGELLFAQYPAGAVAGWLRGGRVSGYTLAQLQAIVGTLTVKIDGVDKTINAVNIAAATSFTNAAALLTTQLAAAGVVVSYDAQSGAFVITSSTTGVNSSVLFATGTAAAALKLTEATGAVRSQGAVAGVPGTNMAAILGTAQNWASFATIFEPSDPDKVLFAEWTSSRGTRIVYAMGDNNPAALVVPDTTSAGALIGAAGYQGVIRLWSAGDIWEKPAFVMGAIASLDFGRRNGRATLAYRSQAGLSADVVDATTARNLLANGYNFYGSYATAGDGWNFLQDGSITGDFLWADSYVNAVWMNDGLQVGLMQMLADVESIPYNPQGYSQIEAACMDAINAALNFGAIRPGVELSPSQVAQVNADAGIRISDTLQQVGWFLQVQRPSAAVRAQRGSPPCTLWYVDGQSVQSINLASVQIQ